MGAGVLVGKIIPSPLFPFKGGRDEPGENIPFGEEFIVEHVPGSMND